MKTKTAATNRQCFGYNKSAVVWLTLQQTNRQCFGMNKNRRTNRQHFRHRIRRQDRRPISAVRPSSSVRPGPSVHLSPSISVRPGPSVPAGRFMSICPCPSVQIRPFIYFSVQVRLSRSVLPRASQTIVETNVLLGRKRGVGEKAKLSPPKGVVEKGKLGPTRGSAFLVSVSRPPTTQEKLDRNNRHSCPPFVLSSKTAS